VIWHLALVVAKKASSQSIRRELRRALEGAADPAKAGPMQAYMKSEMPYYGVQTPQLRKICREIFSEHRLEDFQDWTEAVLLLWRSAKRREERYAAIELSGHRYYRDFQTMKTLHMYEEMIVTGAWATCSKNIPVL